MKLSKCQSVIGVIMIAILVVIILTRLSEPARGGLIFFGAMLVVGLLSGALIVSFARDLLQMLARFLKK